MDPLSIVTLLRKSQFFGRLDDKAVAALARQMRETKFGNGQVIFSRGDKGGEIYLVLEGRVRLSVLSQEGRELSFAHAEPGQVFGEIAALDNGSRTADATAVSPVRAAVLSKAALRQAIDGDPAVAHSAIDFLCARLRDADSQLEAIALHPIEVRLARYLLAQVHARPDAVAGGKARLNMEMSQTELALRVGASRPKVNLAITKLEELGAIERSGNALVCDVEELEGIAAI